MTRIAMVAATLLVCGTAQAQASKSNTQQPMKLEDAAKFLYNTSQAEIEIAQLAEKNASDPQVKQLARTVMQHHQQMNQQLTTAAQQAKVDVKKASTDKTAKMLDKQMEQTKTTLQGLQGEQFDRAFLAANVMSHDSTLGVLENAMTNAATGTSAQNQQALMQAITQAAPMIAQHRQQAYQMLGTMAPEGQISAGTGTTPPAGSGSRRTSQPGSSPGGSGSSGSGTGSGSGSGSGSGTGGTRGY